MHPVNVRSRLKTTWNASITNKRSVPGAWIGFWLSRSPTLPQNFQIARAKAVKAEFVKRAEHEAKEGRKAGDIIAEGVIVGVGLIQGDQNKAHNEKSTWLDNRYFNFWFEPNVCSSNFRRKYIFRRCAYDTPIDRNFLSKGPQVELCSSFMFSPK